MSSSAVRAGRAYVEIAAKDKTQAALKSAEKRMKRFGASVAGMGAKFLAVGAAGAIAIGAITGTLAGFDSKMNAVEAKTGATGEALQQLRDTAKELGATTQFSAVQAAEGMEFLAQAGFNAEQILSAIPSVLSLAAAGALELGEAADIASDVGGAFGLTADEIGRVADVIAKTATSTNTSVSMMGETFAKVAPVARAAGQSIEEVSAAAGILGNSGIKASVAGTDLKNVLATIAKTDSAAKLKELGISLTDANDEMRPLLDIMRDFGDKTASMKGPERLATAMDIFGKISGKSALILSTAGDQVEILREKMANAEGAAAAMAATMQQGVPGALNSAKSAAEGLVIELGEALKPAILGVVNAGTQVIRWATEFIKNNQGLAMALAGTVAAVSALGVGLIILGGTAIAVGAMISGLSTIIAVAGTVATTFAGIAATIGAPLIIAAAAVTALGVAFVGLVGYVAYSNGQLGKAFAWLGEKLTGLLSVAKTVVGGIATAFQSGQPGKAASILWAGIKVVFWSGVNEAIKIFKKLPWFMAELTESTLRAVVNNFGKAFTRIGSMISAFVRGDITALGEAIMGAGELSMDGIKSVASPKSQEKKARAELKALLDSMKPGEFVGPIQEKTKQPTQPPEFVGPIQPQQPPEFVGPTQPKQPGDFVGPMPRDELDKQLESLIKAQDDKDKAFAAKVVDVDPKVAANQVEAAATGSSSGGGSTSGTTSTAAAALAGFTSDPASQRTAKAVEKSAVLLESIDRNLANSEAAIPIV